MKELFENLVNAAESGEDTVLVSIIAGSGSVPRGLGARMLVGKSGRICGTIGGGAVEYRSIVLAAEVLKEKSSYSKAFTLRRNEVEDLGMVCGGDVRVYFQFVASDNTAFLELAKKCIAASDENKNTWLVTDLTDEANWRMAIYEMDGGDELEIGEDVSDLLLSGAVPAEIDGRNFYAEPLTIAGRVIIFGGGHVASELVPVLAHLDFRVVIFEDREDFAVPSMFPGAEQVILGDFNNVAEKISINADDFIVAVTRGHASDYDVQRQVLQGETAYIGVIGSRKKKAAVDARLLEAGIPQERINDVVSPIGTAIKAKTPAEIAISIAGQLIEARATKMGT